MLRENLSRYKVGDHPFVDTSIHERLSKIVRTASTADEAVRSKLESTADDLSKGSLLVVNLDSSDGGPDWTEMSVNYVGKSCDEVDWLFLEIYVYRLILNVTNFFSSNVDPFREKKKEAFQGALATFEPVDDLNLPIESLQNKKDILQALIYRMLWGNRADLSLSGGAVEDITKREADEEFLLVNQSIEVVEILSESSTKNVVIVLDNCGAELMADLDFCYFFLENFPETRVTLHSKSHPVFVSDALESDVEWHIKEMTAKHPVIYKQFTEFRESNRLHITSHPFYTSPLSSWDMPVELKQEISSADLVIYKGDANYRRLVGDLKWDPSVAFVTALDYFGETKVAALRTCKCPVLVGLGTEDQKKFKEKDSEYRVNGKFGVIQLRK